MDTIILSVLRTLLGHILAYLHYINKRLFVDWLKLPIDLTGLRQRQENARISKKLGTTSIAGRKDKRAIHRNTRTEA